VHANQLSAYRLDEQCRNDRRVHAAGKGQQYLLVAYLRSDLADLLCDERISQLLGGDSFHSFGTSAKFHIPSSVFLSKIFRFLLFYAFL
jgi:hypothetical protein